MGTTTFVSLVNYVIAHGYFIFFIACFFEGPIVTIAAGVAVALGYYSLPIIVLISILGDIVPDGVFYFVGFYGGRKLIKKYGEKVGLTPERVLKIRKLLHQNMTKTMLFVKLSPLIPVPGLILIGSLKASFKKYLRISLIITVPKSLTLVLVGLLAGKAYERYSGVFNNISYILFGVVILIFLTYYAYSRVTSNISKSIESSAS